MAPLPGPARRLAEHVGAIVTSVADQPREVVAVTGVRCRRRPRRRSCPGEIRAVIDGESNIVWECPACGDNGVIHHWQGTPWDSGRSERPADKTKAGHGSRRNVASIRPTLVEQFLIVLNGADPLVWRRIQVPKRYSFWDLHVAIQDAMGWRDYHFHEFTVVNPKRGSFERIGSRSRGTLRDPRVGRWQVRSERIRRTVGSIRRSGRTVEEGVRGKC